eukprot:462257-Pelagomonas_calceolata.AAC.3
MSSIRSHLEGIHLVGARVAHHSDKSKLPGADDPVVLQVPKVDALEAAQGLGLLRQLGSLQTTCDMGACTAGKRGRTALMPLTGLASLPASALWTTWGLRESRTGEERENSPNAAYRDGFSTS